MDIKPSAAQSFVARPGADVRVFLLFGTDEGLIREWGEALCRQVVEDLDDPFRFAEIDGPSLSSDAGALYDEATAMAFGGGARVVRVRRLTGRISDLVLDFIKAPAGDARVVIEAPGANKKSATVKAAIASKAAAAVPCYHDENRSLREIVAAALEDSGLRADAATIEFIADHAGSDRALTRREIEKLALYIGAAPGTDLKPVRLEEAQAAIGDTALLTMDSLIDAVFDGRMADMERNLRRVLLEGTSAASILRAAGNYIARLMRYCALVEGGQPAGSALRRLRPPIHFSRQKAFSRHTQLGLRALTLCMDRIAEAERTTRKTGAPDSVVCSRALAGIAATVKRR